jgi:tetratricopeptide (TPR) repeat protein
VVKLADRAGFESEVEEKERLQRELRIVDGWSGFHRALLARMDGRFEESERLTHEAFVALQRQNAENATQGFGAVITELRRLQGRLVEMEPSVKANAEQYVVLPVYRALLAGIYSSDGRREDARALFDELAERGFDQLPSDGLLPVTLSLLADVCWFLSDTDRAPELYEMLVPRNGELVTIGWANTSGGPVSRCLGILAATMRRWDDAERHFEDALYTMTEFGDKPWLAQTRAQYAEVLLSRGATGDRERALDLAALALEAGQEMGMKRVVDDCVALSAQAQAVN